ncbi:MAG: histidine phosphatase family protein [Arenicellales bacterium]
MTLLIARHGQTDWNLARRWQSRSDIPLNATGVTQADSLALQLLAEQYRPVRIISSPLSRARQTAEIMGRVLGLSVEVDQRLTELDLGEWEGCLEAELRAEDPARYDHWRSEGYLIAPPGGESLFDVAERVRPLVTELKTDPGDLLLVGHQGVNMALKAELSGCFEPRCLEQFRQANDEMDMWSIVPARSIKRLKAE